MTSPIRPWRRTSRREILSHPPRVSVFVDTVELPDGRIIDDYYRVRCEDSVIIFAETRHGKILTLRNYRHGLERVVLGFPGGHREEGEDWQACAARELLEETGYQATIWRDLGRFVHNDNRFIAESHLFHALDCEKTADVAHGDLEDTEVLHLSTADLFAALAAGELASICHVALLGLATHPEFLSMTHRP